MEDGKSRAADACKTQRGFELLDAAVGFELDQANGGVIDLQGFGVDNILTADDPGFDPEQKILPGTFDVQQMDRLGPRHVHLEALFRGFLAGAPRQGPRLELNQLGHDDDDLKADQAGGAVLANSCQQLLFNIATKFANLE